MLLVASLDMILSNKQKNKGADQAARMRMLVCAFVDRKSLKTDFLALLYVVGRGIHNTLLQPRATY